MELGKGGGAGSDVGDGIEEEGCGDSVAVFGLGYGLVSGLGLVCSGDKGVGPVSIGVWCMGEAVGVLWACLGAVLLLESPVKFKGCIKEG